jgi:hypothetical protein
MHVFPSLIEHHRDISFLTTQFRIFPFLSFFLIISYHQQRIQSTMADEAIIKISSSKVLEDHDEIPGPTISLPDSGEVGEGGKLSMIFPLVKKCLAVKNIAAMSVSFPYSPARNMPLIPIHTPSALPPSPNSYPLSPRGTIPRTIQHAPRPSPRTPRAFHPPRTSVEIHTCRCYAQP